MMRAVSTHLCVCSTHTPWRCASLALTETSTLNRRWLLWPLAVEADLAPWIRWSDIAEDEHDGPDHRVQSEDQLDDVPKLGSEAHLM